MNIDKKERLFELLADQTVFDLSKAVFITVLLITVKIIN